jgi:hypothetical protein
MPDITEKPVLTNGKKNGRWKNVTIFIPLKKNGRKFGKTRKLTRLK